MSPIKIYIMMLFFSFLKHNDIRSLCTTRQTYQDQVYEAQNLDNSYLNLVTTANDNAVYLNYMLFITLLNFL